MSTTTKYTDTLQKITITRAQAIRLDEYCEIISENGNIKIIKEFDDNELIVLEYYLDSTENRPTVLAQLRLDFPNSSSYHLITTVTHGNLTEYVSEIYFSNPNRYAPLKGRWLVDFNGYRICSEDTDLLNGIIPGDSDNAIKKYFYDETVFLQNCIAKVMGGGAPGGLNMNDWGGSISF